MQSYKNPTQTELLLNHMLQVGSITPYQASDLYRVHSFHRRMADLRQTYGVRFNKTRKTDNTGRPYVEYRFAGFEKNR